MTETDLDAFMAETRRVATIFRFRASPVELGQITHAYFKAFKGRPLSAVIAGADAWIAKGARFPKPAEWLENMPRPGAHAVDVPTMGMDDAHAWVRAESLRWEDAPCGCLACRAAEVDERPLRFVPEMTEDDRDLHMFNPVNNRIVTAGHWAHGDELARWYVAKANFYNRCLELGLRGDVLKPTKKRSTFTERLNAIFPTKPTTPEPPTREPGSDDGE